MLNIEEYLNNYFKGSFATGTEKPTLNAMKYFMDEYNHFELSMRFIHIAGTNGKGSIAEMLNSILLKQGYNVGKFISPHLIRYNERIVVNNIEITDDELESLIKELKPKIDKYNSLNKTAITLFELETIMALLFFYRKNVDIVVLETGLGGLYDCTNIITKPLVSVISSIGYDHMHILGSTLTEIAMQKAGIIKENSNTVIFSQTNDVNKVIENVCREKNNKLYIVKREELLNYSMDANYQYIDYEDYKYVAVVLKGKKQIENAAVCIKCIEILNDLGIKVSEENIREGLRTTVHRARMEVIKENPLIIYDGAHNEPAILNLLDMVSTYYPKKKRVYVISILKRKDYTKMLEILLKDTNADFIFTSGNDITMYTSSQELYDVALRYRTNQRLYMKPLNEAIGYIVSSSEDTVNFVVGSFYVYGDVKKYIAKNGGMYI